MLKTLLRATKKLWFAKLDRELWTGASLDQYVFTGLFCDRRGGVVPYVTVVKIKTDATPFVLYGMSVELWSWWHRIATQESSVVIPDGFTWIPHWVFLGSYCLSRQSSSLDWTAFNLWCARRARTSLCYQWCKWLPHGPESERVYGMASPLSVIYVIVVCDIPRSYYCCFQTPYAGSTYHNVLNRLSGDVNKAGHWSKEDEITRSRNGGLS
jgi:hypothetical protein